MSDRQETTADIIAEMRMRSDEAYKGSFNYPECQENQIEYNEASEWADRLEAAHKRERGDCAKLREAIENSNGLLEELAAIGEWGESAREQIAENNAALAAPATAEKSSAVGDVAKLREALVHIKDRLPHMLQYMRVHWEDASAGGYFDELMLVIDAALAAPPRNCNRFATAEEARQAWLDDAGNWDEFGSPKLELHEWLYATATEKEGGAND